jgi:hypothetical protein
MAAKSRPRQIQIRSLMLAVAVVAVCCAALRLPGIAALAFGFLHLALLMALPFGVFALIDRVTVWWAGRGVQPPIEVGPGRVGNGPT